MRGALSVQTIMVVEDEPAIARVLTVYLRKAGFEVELAADGRQALDLFALETQLSQLRIGHTALPSLGLYSIGYWY